MKRFYAGLVRRGQRLPHILLSILAVLLLSTAWLQAQDTGNAIDFHGGPVLTNPHPVYIIWYGNWNGNSALALLPDFLSSLSGSPYFAINSTYENGSHNNVSSTVTVGGQTFDSYSQSTTLSDAGVRAVVSNAISRGAFPINTNGVYFVLSSGDVNQIGGRGEFCIDVCGFHDHMNFLLFYDIKYAFVGNAFPKCINNPNSATTCAANSNQVLSPNDNTGADAMASVIAHELSEAVTDPDYSAWYRGDASHENADLCQWTFGPNTFTTPNGATANVTLGGRNFLLQQNWLNDGGGRCTMASSGNPFTYRNARDEFLACYGIAGRISSNCNDISDINDKQTCFAVSDSTQGPCGSMTDRNMQLACYGIAFAPNFPSNCRDINNPQMQAFCYGASSGNTNPAPNCNNVVDSDARALCLGMAWHDPTQCNSISGHNDRQFCLGVSSHDNSNCASISSCPDPNAQAACINSGGSWDWSACSCAFGPTCDPNQEQLCLNQGGSWDPSTCSCSGGCGTELICTQVNPLGQGGASAALPPSELKLRKPLPAARPTPRTAEPMF